jgi:hypothetical protein
MTVTTRVATPALLQVDSILTHLAGPGAAEEISRYLGAELPHFRRVLIVPGPAGAVGLVPPELVGVARWVQERSGPATTAWIEAQVQLPAGSATFEVRSAAAAPVRDAGEVLGWTAALSDREQAFDVTDRLFLERLSVKLVTLVRAPSSLPTI